MKKGIHDLPFLSSWTWEQFITQAADTGFDGVEFNLLDGEGYLPLDISHIDALRIAQRCKDVHLQVPSLSTNLHNRFPLSSSDKRIRKRGEEIALHMIEIAQLIGAEVIQIVPGVTAPDIRYDQAYQWAQESLAKLAVEASAAGVTIGVENVSNKFLPSPQEFARFLNEIAHPSVLGYFDTGNAMATGHPEHWIQLLSSSIVTVHVKDFHSATHTFLSPLSGDTDWPAVMDALHRSSFAGYLITTPPKYAYCPERLMESAFRDLDAIVSLGKEPRSLLTHDLGGVKS